MMTISQTMPRGRAILLGICAIIVLGAGFSGDASAELYKKSRWELSLEPRIGWFEPYNARESYEELFGVGNPIIGGDFRFRMDNSGIQFGLGFDFFYKNGEKAYIRRGEVRGSGESLDLMMIPLTLSVMYGYDFNDDVRFYLGLGAALTLWDQGDGFETQTGPSYIVGMRLKTFKRWHAGFEYRYLQVPDALDRSGIGRFFREDDIGGHQIFFTMSFVKIIERLKKIL